MFFNRIEYTPQKQLKLVMISPLLTWGIKGLMFLLLGLGLLVIIATINPNLPYLPLHIPATLDWLGILGGIGLIITAQLVSLIDRILAEMKLSCIFDAAKQAFYFTTPAKSVYDFLKKPLPFIQIRAIRLKRIETVRKPHQWLLELIVERVDHKPDQPSGNTCFYPIGFFRDAQKVQRFIKLIQTFVNVACTEEIVTDYSFRSQKDAFLKQFDSQNTSQNTDNR